MSMSNIEVSPIAVPRTSGRDPRTVARQSLAICRRNLAQMRGEPADVVITAVMPMLIAVIFVYVFGGAISGGGDYKQYLLPGLMVETVTMTCQVTGLSLNMDFNNGMMDRFRSFPIARSSVLIGRIGADMCRMLFAQTVMLIFAFIIGFRAYGGVLGMLTALLVMFAFGVGLACVSAFIGLIVKGGQTIHTVGFVWLIPLQFGSSMFVSPGTMPGWLRGVVDVNPVTLVCDACRDLMTGAATGGSVLGALAWAGGLVALFGPLAVMQYIRRV
jgi:oleandomycin transport system permease protein